MGILTSGNSDRKLTKFRPVYVRVGGKLLCLRHAKRQDAKALNAIVNEEDVNRFLLRERPLSLASTFKAIENDLRHLWVVAEWDGQVVGSVMIRPEEGRKDITCSFGIAFSKKAHGTGIPAAAMESALAWMKRNHFHNCTAEVFDENERARKFYRKMGFVEIAHIPNVRRRSGGRLGGEIIIQKVL